jgi:hypothetical protein
VCVGVRVSVGVSVFVGVFVGVNVCVGVKVFVGVSVLVGVLVGTTGSNSNAPRSQLENWGRVIPRWSLVVVPQLVAASKAKLELLIAIVQVGPPLLANAPRPGSPVMNVPVQLLLFSTNEFVKATVPPVD